MQVWKQHRQIKSTESTIIKSNLLKKIAILQSNYIPWIGYFDMMSRVDEFVIYDDAQFTKRDWRNRNRIKTPDGVMWLTIPVEVKDKFSQTIRETKVSGKAWIRKHCRTLNNNYSRSRHFNDIYEWLVKIYNKCQYEVFLSDINLLFIREITEYLGINTKISFSSDYSLIGDRSARIMNICLQAGSNEYLSGPAAKSYLDLEAFNRVGITVRWMNYSNYQEYPQLYPPFIHEVSILDLLFNIGEDSIKYMNRVS
jgi:hypothetical protein